MNIYAPIDFGHGDRFKSEVADVRELIRSVRDAHSGNQIAYICMYEGRVTHGKEPETKDFKLEKRLISKKKSGIQRAPFMKDSNIKYLSLSLCVGALNSKNAYAWWKKHVLY